MPVSKPRLEYRTPGELARLTLAGQIRVPPVERSFRWGKNDVARLWDSIYRGYPVGNLLMWERPAQEATVTVGPLTMNVPAAPLAWWVVDGQQRITALAATLHASTDTVNPAFRIFFDARDERFIPVGRGETVPEHWLPLNIGDITRWQRARPMLSDAEIQSCEALRVAMRDYGIPVYVVEGDEELVAADIFDRLNTSRHRLTRTEAFDALHRAAGQMEPRSLVTLAARVKGFGFGPIDEGVLEETIEAIPGESSDSERSLALIERALGHSIDFLRDECGIPHVRVLPHSFYLPVFARFVALFGPPSGRPAELLRRWAWRMPVTESAPQPGAWRRFLDAIGDNPMSSATRLLELVPAEGAAQVPDLNAYDLARPDSRLMALALIAQHPRLLVDGESGRAGDPVDVAGLLDSFESPFAPFGIATQRHGVFGWMTTDSLVTRLIHPPLGEEDLTRAISLRDLNSETLRSQCLDRACAKLLRAGDAEGFIEHRAGLMARLIQRNVQRRALFGFRDGPDPESLFADVENAGEEHEGAGPDGA